MHDDDLVDKKNTQLILFSRLQNSGVSAFQELKCMAVSGNAIHTGAKCPLKQDVCISLVQNTVNPLITDPPKSGQPLYSRRLTCPRLILI